MSGLCDACMCVREGKEDMGVDVWVWLQMHTLTHPLILVGACMVLSAPCLHRDDAQ